MRVSKLKLGDLLQTQTPWGMRRATFVERKDPLMKVKWLHNGQESLEFINGFSLVPTEKKEAK